MNRILTLSVHPTHGRPGQGLKGKMLDESLSGVDLFTGPNNAGKTTRLDAVGALLAGLASVPTDVKRPFVGPLPLDTAVSATVRMGDGGTVTISRPLDVSKGKAHDAAAGEIKTVLGAPVVAPSLRDFTSATAGERAKVLDAVARAGGSIESWDVPRARKAVLHILAPEGTPKEELPPLTEYRAVWAALTAADDGASWLANALAWAEERQKATNAAQKTAAAHHAELSATPIQSAVSGADADAARMEELRRDLVRLDDAAKNATAAREALGRHEAEGKRLETQLAAIVEEGKALATKEPPPDETIPAHLTLALTEAADALDAPIPAPGIDIPALEAAVKDAEEEVTRAAAKVTTDRAAAEAATATLTEARGAWTAADKALALAELDYHAAADFHPPTAPADSTCRHCGESDPMGIAAGWTERHAEVLRLQAIVTEARANLATVAATLTAADTAEHGTRGNLFASERMHQSATRTLETARAALTRGRKATETHAPAVRATRQQAVTRAQAAIDHETARIAAEVTRWQQREARREADRLAKLARWRETKAARAAWEAVPAPVVPPTEDTAADRALIESEMLSIRARDNQRQEAKAAARLVEESAVKAAAAVTTWGETKALVSAIRQARDDMARAAYQPIHDAARALVSGVPHLPLPYFAGPADYGAEIDGIRVPYHGLGQSAALIVGACLSYALAVVSAQPCRVVLLDGIEVIPDPADRHALLSALVSAQRAGQVDNVLLTMATAPGVTPDVPEGVTVHAVTPYVRPVVMPPIQDDPTTTPAPKRTPTPPPVALPTEPDDADPF